MNYTPQQLAFKEALLSTPGNIRLDAVAGAGKTTTLVSAVQGIPPTASVITTAFNKRIAETLTKKVPSHVTAKTFNAIGHRAFSQAIGKRLALNADKLDQLALELFPKERSTFAEVAVVKALKSRGVRPKDLTEELVEEIAFDKDFFKPPRYEFVLKLLEKNIETAYAGLVDFDDQIYMSVLFAGVFDRHDFVLVDEAQDLSPLQMDMIKRLGRQSCKYAFIGDPNQAIYGFRGAGITSMDEVAERFATTSMPLSVSFRCPVKVVELARAIVSRIQSAPGAPLGTINDWRESNWLLAEIKPGDTVLCRNNAPLIALALRMYQQRIPARVLGKDIGMGLIRFIGQFGSDSDPSDMVANKALARLESDIRIADAKRKLSRVAQLEDRMETISAMASFAPRTWGEWRGQLQSIFAPPGDHVVTLSSIHKAKGLEFPNVFFLDRELLPSPRAKQDWERQQEDNLYYVAVTRVVGDGKLTFINSRDAA